MSEVIDKPVEAPAIAQALALQAVTTQVGEFNAIESGLAAMAERYANLAFDVTTTKGMDEAKKARMEIREVRYKAQNLLTETKKPLNEIKEQIDALAKGIIARIEAIEEPIDKQIKAEEKRKADEKAERERIAAEDAAKVQARIDNIRDFLVRAAGASAQQLAELGRELGAIDVSLDAFGDRTGEAQQLKAQVLDKLLAMGVAEAERVLAQVQLKKQQDELAEQRAAFEAEQAEARAKQAERDAIEQREREERQAAEDQERARKALIQEHLDDLQQYRRYAGVAQASTIALLIADLEELKPNALIFGERVAEAEATVTAILSDLKSMHASALEREAAQQRQAEEEERQRAEKQYLQAALARLQKSAPAMFAALQVAEQLLDSVAFVATEGDTDEPLAIIRAAMALAKGE